MNRKRQQLTLLIEDNESENIEKIRKTFNSKQYDLIKSHVTLCREDEIEDIEKVIVNLRQINHACITIDFGNVVRFSDGKGVLMPAVGNYASFEGLRECILAGIIEKPRKLEPHITLMHPRNATCTDEVFEQLEKINLPNKITFKKISLIEQEIGKKWHVLHEFELKNDV